MNYLTLDQYNDKQKRAAARVLDSLDQLDARLGSHYSGKRRHTRVQYRGIGTVCLPNPDQAVLDPAGGGSFRVNVRSLSQSGLSFIYPGEIAEKDIIVGLELGGAAATTWFVAEIVRIKPIEEEGFWEFGVRFLRRAVM